MTEVSGVGNLQTLKPQARATSKFKLLEPTKLADLIKHGNGKYNPIDNHEIETINPGDLVKIVFINNEELWIDVDSADLTLHEANLCEGLVYGKTCQQAMRVHGLQKGQRVCFDVKCVAGIQYHSDSDDDSD